jgi:Skp family chaperone for outer membrane proteins
MTVKTILAFGALASLTLASAASAQAAAAAAPANGPAIAGVCVFFRDEALATSTAGKGVSTRMNELRAQVNAELSPEAQSLQSQEQALQTTPKEQQQTKAVTLRDQIGAFQQKEQQRSQELQATLQKQVSIIGQAMAPIVEAVYSERKCSILLDRGQVYFQNPDMDVTAVVVQRLDAKLPSVPAFSREALSQQGAAAAPAPAAPTSTTHNPTSTTHKK